ncbi:hypothetical protein CEXT_797451 [Caerostris extrusa]|uniref:Uncharacterized protein n=1 Tax=Caerostris extrusa TaxID=172846 RepID=A0AAV4SGP2_CAEEX|nr:hypothetical protein CEXT_797451 [Caerostris extrusa]
MMMEQLVHVGRRVDRWKKGEFSSRAIRLGWKPATKAAGATRCYRKVEALPYALITATFVLFKVGKRKLLLIMAVAAGKNRASVFREAKREAGFQMIYWNKEKFCRTLVPKSVGQ